MTADAHQLDRTTLRHELWTLIRRHRVGLVVVLLMMPISAVAAMLVPYLTKVAIDSLILPAAETGDLAGMREPLVELVTLAMGVVLVGYLADAFYVSLMQRIGQQIIAALRDVVYRRSLRLPRRFYDTHPIGTVLTRVTSDIEALGEVLATGALSLFMDGLKTIAYLTMMFLLDWRLTLVLLLLLPLLAVVVTFFQARIRRVFFRARQSLSEATGYLQECLNGIKTIQLYGAERHAIDRFKRLNRRYLVNQNQSNVYDALLFSLVEGISTLTIAFMLWYSAGELLTSVLTIGVLVAFMEYIQRLFVPVREFSQQVAVLQRAAGALDHIDELFRVPLDPKELAPRPADAAPRNPEDPPGAIVFDDVRFRYRAEGPEILKGISFCLRRGQTLAIVGATGSGKSTIIRLLSRAYSGYEGSIRIDGRELRDIAADELSGMLSVVHQDVFLFQGSLAFNIGLAREALAHSRIKQAASYVSADRFVSRLEGGFDFPIIQGGANLSAGQAQLIAFARAVAAETEFIVLDEATSSVDSMTEHLIQEAVGRLYQDKTVVAIAHRLSTIRLADTILVMRAGEVAEAGSHEALMARGGLYARLVSGADHGAIAADAVPPATPAPGDGR